MGRHSTAHYFLEGLVDLGVEYIFANLGTDHVSLIEEMARWDKEGRKHPEMILCPHEVVAVHMAGGYALATGRAQAVLVHVDAGTANACMAIQNLFRYRLPVMLFAGRAPHTLHGELTGSRDTYVHFVQDPFDIASIVRPYVKWEYSLPSGVVVKEALARASAFAQSDPPGPVYMTLPRELLMATVQPGDAIASEGLLILGWVAMWKPVEIFLYDWWPDLDKRRLFKRVAHMQIETQPGPAAACPRDPVPAVQLANA